MFVSFPILYLPVTATIQVRVGFGVWVVANSWSVDGGGGENGRDKTRTECGGSLRGHPGLLPSCDCSHPGALCVCLRGL
mgnify:CR=1 FL=1